MKKIELLRIIRKLIEDRAKLQAKVDWLQVKVDWLQSVIDEKQEE